MKTFPTVLSLLALLVSANLSDLAAQEKETPERTISVSGSSEKSLPADRVEISVQIRSVRKTLTEAREASMTVFSTVAKQLATLGVPEDKIELRNHSLGKEYRNGPNRERIHEGFYSERDFQIELDDTALLETIYEDLAKMADIRVSGTYFSRKDDIQIRKELRKQALTAAKEKATEMAAVYELFIGKPLKISESGGGFSPAQFNTRNIVSSEAGSSVKGRVHLSSSVMVVFELVD